MPLRTGPATARTGLEVAVLAVVAQGRLARIDLELDRAAASPVAAVGAAARDVGLMTEGRGAVAAVAGAKVDLHLVEEHQSGRRIVRPGDRAASGPTGPGARSARIRGR